MKKTLLIAILVSLLVPCLSQAFDDSWGDFDRRQSEWRIREEIKQEGRNAQYERERMQRDQGNNRNSSANNYYYNTYETTTYQEPRRSAGNTAAELALAGFKGFLDGESRRRERQRYSQPAYDNYRGPSQEEFDIRMRELDEELARIRAQDR